MIASATWNAIFTDISTALTQTGQGQITENPRIISTPGNVTVGTTDRILLIEANVGTISLPASATKLNPLTVIGNGPSIFAGQNALITTTGGETINGATSTTLTASYQSITLLPLASGGWVIPSGSPVYQAGTWTPTFSFGAPGDLTVNYAEQLGYWQRIGQWVTVGCVAIFTPTFTTASQQAKIATIPYPSDDDYVGALEWINVSLSPGYTQLNAITGGTGASSIVFEAIGSGVSGSALGSMTALNFRSGSLTALRFNIMYHTAAP